MSQRAQRAKRLVLSLSVLGLGATSVPHADFERAVNVPQPGKVFLVLDRAVYESARPDLADLRVLDETGAQVPYLLEEPWSGPESTLRQPRILNRGFVGEEGAIVTLDFGGPLLKSGLLLSLSGQNFRRRVMVEGRNKHERPWATLTDSAYVFAIPEPPAARFESVALPEHNYQYLRVTVFRGPDDPPRIDILNVWARCEERRRPREVALAAAQMTRSEDTDRNETLLTLDLGARHQPFHALVLDVASGDFFRGWVLEARREPPSPGQGVPAAPISWARLGEGSLYRYQSGERLSEQVRIDAGGRERVLRVRIANRDDRPLEIRGVSVMVPVERLVFTADPGRRYRLSYGAPGLGRPEYDVQRTVRDPAIWIAQGQEGTLSGPVRVPSVPPLVPWTERHKGLLWGGLVTVVLLLGTVAWRALKAV